MVRVHVNRYTMLYEAIPLTPVQVCQSFVKSMGVERIDVLPDLHIHKSWAKDDSNKESSLIPTLSRQPYCCVDTAKRPEQLFPLRYESSRPGMALCVPLMQWILLCPKCLDNSFCLGLLSSRNHYRHWRVELEV